MTHHGAHRQWAREFESRLSQHAGGWRGSGGPGGPGGWSAWGGSGAPSRRSGPPPWLSGIFGLAAGGASPPRGPRARRGDVRVAILDVLAAEPLNGYQVIGEIGERTGGLWRPSPGSVYPTISQLEDEGLIEADDQRGRRTLRLSEAGRDYLAEHPDEVAAVWAPFAEDQQTDRLGDEGPDFTTLKPELGRVLNAVWQIITTGTDEQRRAAIGVLTATRRDLYSILADDVAQESAEDGAAEDGPAGGASVGDPS